MQYSGVELFRGTENPKSTGHPFSSPLRFQQPYFVRSILDSRRLQQRSTQAIPPDPPSFALLWSSVRRAPQPRSHRLCRENPACCSMMLLQFSTRLSSYPGSAYSKRNKGPKITRKLNCQSYLTAVRMRRERHERRQPTVTDENVNRRERQSAIGGLLITAPAATNAGYSWAENVLVR